MPSRPTLMRFASKRAIRLLGCREHGEPRPRLEIAIVANLVADNRNVRRDHDLLLAVLVSDNDR